MIFSYYVYIYGYSKIKLYLLRVRLVSQGAVYNRRNLNSDLVGKRFFSISVCLAGAVLSRLSWKS